MANERVSRRYATAILSLASEHNAVDVVGRDLERMNDAIASDATTKQFFIAPVIDAKEKARVLSETLGRGAHELALHALLLLVRKRREALLPEIVQQYKQLEMHARGAEPLTVTTAVPLSADDMRNMIARLEKVYEKKFDVTQQVDPSLIGGVRIMMGDRRIDDSIAGRFEELSRSLFAKN